MTNYFQMVAILKHRTDKEALLSLGESVNQAFAYGMPTLEELRKRRHVMQIEIRQFAQIGVCAGYWRTIITRKRKHNHGGILEGYQ